MIAKNQADFHKIVCERDNFQCQVCKTSYNHGYCFDEQTGVNKYVCGHHLQRKNTRPDLKLETANGKCVDQKCHDLIHKGLKTL